MGRPHAASGIIGTVTAAPICPVERIDTPCPPQPVSAPINLQNVEGRTIATTKSTVDGRYELSAPAGRYTIIVKTDVFPRCPATPATVTLHQLTTVDVSCDSGIR